MKSIFIFVLIIIILVGAAILIMHNEKVNNGLFDKPGNCPNCGKPLIKGIYGTYYPHIVWYCPMCP